MSTDEVIHEICQTALTSLKGRAKDAKEMNDMEGAMIWLKYCKVIETEEEKWNVNQDEDNENDTSSGPNSLAMELKKLAILFKKDGDLENAKEFLRASKQVDYHIFQLKKQKQEQEQVQHQPENEQVESTPDDTDIGENQNNSENNNGNDDDDKEAEKALMELQNGGSSNQEDQKQQQQQQAEIAESNDILEEENNLLVDSMAAVTFTDTEMMDPEMMKELQEGGMTVPSQEVYAERVLHYKHAALAAKQANDIPKATAELRKAKLLQHVASILKEGTNATSGTSNNDSDDAWMNELSSEDAALLGELMDGDAGGEDVDMSGMDGNTADTLGTEDLEGMDDEDLMTCIEMGMTLPLPETLLEEATEKQKEALGYKQSGNIDLAKMALMESKKLKIQAARIEVVLAKSMEAVGGQDQAENNLGEGEVNEHDLETLWKEHNQAEKAPKEPVPKPAAPKKVVDPWMEKPAEEIKKEVIRLKNAKNVAEATRLLQIYKLVLKKEADAAEAAKCQKLVDLLKEEMAQSTEQQNLYSYYQRFVNESFGAEQLSLWEKYSEQCQLAIRIIQAKGSKSIQLSRNTETKLKNLNGNEIQGIVEQGTMSSGALNGDLEITIMEVLNVGENKTLQKYLSKLERGKENDLASKLCPQLSIDCKIHLPPLNGDDSSVHCIFQASDSKRTNASDEKTPPTFQYKFSESKSISLPRGDSRPAKTNLRRLETKTAIFSISAQPPPPEEKAKSKSWFWRGGNSSKDDEKKNVNGDNSNAVPANANIGKASIELNELLTRNCIIGEFPLLVNMKPVGGTVRLCLRTDQPFDPSRYEGFGSALLTSVTPPAIYSKALLFTVPKPAQPEATAAAPTAADEKTTKES